MKVLYSLRQNFFLLALLFSCVGWQVQANAESAENSTVEVMTTVNINTASASDIAATLNGVGEKRAEAIVAYREANGAYKKPEDLLVIKGIGDKLLEKNAGKMTF